MESEGYFSEYTTKNSISFSIAEKIKYLGIYLTKVVKYLQGELQNIAERSHGARHGGSCL